MMPSSVPVMAAPVAVGQLVRTSASHSAYDLANPTNARVPPITYPSRNEQVVPDWITDALCDARSLPYLTQPFGSISQWLEPEINDIGGPGAVVLQPRVIE